MAPTLRKSEPCGPIARAAAFVQRVVVAAVAHAQVVGRRRHDYRNRAGCHAAEHIEAVRKIEAERAAAGIDLGVRFGKPGGHPHERHRGECYISRPRSADGCVESARV